MKIHSIVIICLVFCLIEQTLGQDNVKALEKKVNELEDSLQELRKQQAEIYERSVEGPGVGSFLSSKISFGGYLESAFQAMTGPDTEAQATATHSFLGINLGAAISPKTRFAGQILNTMYISQVNKHNNAFVTPQRQYGFFDFGSQVTQSYVEHLFDPGFIVQWGLGFAPYGVAYQMRELILFRRRAGPMLSTIPTVNFTGIAFPLWSGLHINGSFSPQEGQRWGYNAYTFSTASVMRVIGFGGRLWYQPHEIVKLGTSYQSGRQMTDDFYSYGFDIDFKYKQFGLLSEYGKNQLYRDTPSPHSYYFEPYFDFHNGQWVLFGVIDYYDAPNFYQSASRIDPYTKWIWGVGVNWHPYNNLRLRAEVFQHDYITHTAEVNNIDRDYHSLDISVSAAF